MTKIIVTGAAGRMGRRIIALTKDPANSAELIGAIEKTGAPDLGRDAGESAGIGRIGVPIESSAGSALSKADAVVDFTIPEGTLEMLPAAAEAGAAMVIGTTGFSKENLAAIRGHAEKIPIVLSPNMSIGVNLLLKLLVETAKVTGDDYDVEILEIHHRHKKDAPSGTAIRMAQVLAETLGRDLDKVGVYERYGRTGERKAGEIGIQALRAGDVVGEHTVIFAGVGERIELTHRAHSRDNFARGALLAAKWVAGKPAGMYDMSDVLGFKS